MTSIKANDCLQTPAYIWKSLGDIDLDPCAGSDTTIGRINLWDGRGECGLTEEWGNNFVYCTHHFPRKNYGQKK